MKFSLFFELPTPDPDDPQAEATCFRQALEQIEFADQLGYDRVWVVEHHFLPGYSHSSCPEVFLAAVSQRTQRIRLGHGIVQCPHSVNHPVRIAERVATLDVLSGGRVDFGAGRGTIPMELAGFGTDPETTRAQMIETLKMLPGMWTEPTFSWDGAFPVPERTIVPKPIQKPHPPLWMAATQPWSVQFAGEHGLGLLGFGISEDEKDDLIRLYRGAIKNAKPIGKFINNQFAVMRMALCCETDEEAVAIQTPNWELFGAQLAAVNSTWRVGDPPKTYEYASERAKRRGSGARPSTEQLVEAGAVVFGSPDTCRRTLETMAESGLDEIILFMQGATTPHDKVMDSIRLIGEQVMPKLR